MYHLFYVSVLKYGCYMSDITRAPKPEQKQAMYKYHAISPAAKVYWEPTLMLDLEYRKLNTKNLLEYIKNGQHILRMGRQTVNIC